MWRCTEKYVKLIVVCVLIVFATSYVRGVSPEDELLNSLQESYDGFISDLEENHIPGDRQKYYTLHRNEIKKLYQQARSEISDAETKEEKESILENVLEDMELLFQVALSSYEHIEMHFAGEVRGKQKEYVALSSMMRGNKLRFYIKSPLDEKSVLQKLLRYESGATVNYMFEEQTSRGSSKAMKSIYLVILPLQSNLVEKYFPDLIDGYIPQKFLGMDLIFPEVLEVDQIPILHGENIDQLWGLQAYEAAGYQGILHEKKQVQVGVVDTGIDSEHPDLQGAMSEVISGYDFVNDDVDAHDDHYHGTHVAGTIAGRANGSGVFGVNSNSALVPLKICTADGLCPTYAIYDAIIYAVDAGVDILNMSLGGKATPTGHPICDAISYASQKGVFVIAAAGNANSDASQYVPAGCPDAITVGAVDQQLHRASFSNYGNAVDVSAPGVDILSTSPGGGWRVLDGTSMAAPHVAGLLSAILAVDTGSMYTKASLMELFDHVAQPVVYEEGKYHPGFVSLEQVMSSLGYVSERTDDKISQNSEAEYLGEETNFNIAQTFPMSLNKDSLSLTVGQRPKVYISGGVAPYTISSEIDIVTFGFVNRALSEDSISLQENNQFIFNQDEWGGELIQKYRSVEVPGWIADEEAIDDDEIGVAEDGFYFRVFALQPGETTITVKDSLGTTISLPVSIGDKVVKLDIDDYSQTKKIKIYGAFTPENLYVRDGLPWVFPSSLEFSYANRFYYPVATAESASTVFFDMYNTHMQRDVEMRVLIKTNGTPTPAFTVEVPEKPIDVGSIEDIVITGGTAPYEIRLDGESFRFLTDEHTVFYEGSNYLVTEGQTFQIEALFSGSSVLTLFDARGRSYTYRIRSNLVEEDNVGNDIPTTGTYHSLLIDAVYGDIIPSEHEIVITAGESTILSVEGGNQIGGYYVSSISASGDLPFDLTAENTENISLSSYFEEETGTATFVPMSSSSKMTVTGITPGKGYLIVRDTIDLANNNYKYEGQHILIPITVEKPVIELDASVDIAGNTVYTLERENERFRIDGISTRNSFLSIKNTGMSYEIISALDNVRGEMKVSVYDKYLQTSAVKHVKLRIGSPVGKIYTNFPENYTGTLWVNYAKLFHKTLGDSSELVIRGGVPPYYIRTNCQYIGFEYLGDMSEFTLYNEKEAYVPINEDNIVFSGNEYSFQIHSVGHQEFGIQSMSYPTAKIRIRSVNHNNTCSISVGDSASSPEFTLPVSVEASYLEIPYSYTYELSAYPNTTLRPINSSLNDWIVEGNTLRPTTARSVGVYPGYITLYYGFNAERSVEKVHIRATPVNEFDTADLDLTRLVYQGDQPEVEDISLKRSTPLIMMDIGESRKLQVIGGTPPYSVSFEGSSVVPLTEMIEIGESNAFLKVAGVHSGPTVVTLTDALGATQQITVEIFDDGASQEVGVGVSVFSVEYPLMLVDLEMIDQLGTKVFSGSSGYWFVVNEQEGEGLLSARVYNSISGQYTQFEKSVLFTESPSSYGGVEGLLKSHQGVSLQVGDLQTVWVSGGTVPYSLFLGNGGVVGFTPDLQNGDDVEVASFNDFTVQQTSQKVTQSLLQEPLSVLVKDSDPVVSSIQYTNTDTFNLFDGSFSQIQSANDSRYFRLFGAKPGTTQVSITDAEGRLGRLGVDVGVTYMTLRSSLNGDNVQNIATDIHSGDRYTITAVKSSNRYMVDVMNMGGGTFRLIPQVFHGEVDLEVEILDHTTGTSSVLYFKIEIVSVEGSGTDIVDQIDESDEAEQPTTEAPTAPLIVDIKDLFTEVGEVIHIDISGGQVSENGYRVEVDDYSLVPIFDENNIPRKAYEKATFVYPDGSTYAISADESFEGGGTFKFLVKEVGIHSLRVSDDAISLSDTSEHTITAKYKWANVMLGSGLLVPFHDDFDIKYFTSDNPEIFSVTEIQEGFDLHANKLGETNARIGFTNQVTGIEEEYVLHINVVLELQDTEEYTIYLDRTKEYSLFLHDDTDYVIEHDGLIAFYNLDEYLHTDIITTTIAETNFEELQKLQVYYDENTYKKGIRILSNEGDTLSSKMSLIVEGGAKKIINVVRGDRYSINEDVLQTLNILQNTNRLTVEEYIIGTFSYAMQTLDSSSIPESYLLFENEFPSGGDRDFKSKLITEGYATEDDNYTMFNGEYVTNSDLGNLLFGFLGAYKGIYEGVLSEAYVREVDNYTLFYGEELAIVRANADENADYPWYNAGYELNEMINSYEIFTDYTSFVQALTNLIIDANIESAPLKEQEEIDVLNVCIASNGTTVELYSCGCSDLFRDLQLDLNNDGNPDEYVVSDNEDNAMTRQSNNC